MGQLQGVAVLSAQAGGNVCRGGGGGVAGQNQGRDRECLLSTIRLIVILTPIYCSHPSVTCVLFNVCQMFTGHNVTHCQRHVRCPPQCAMRWRWYGITPSPPQQPGRRCGCARGCVGRAVATAAAPSGMGAARWCVSRIIRHCSPKAAHVTTVHHSPPSCLPQSGILGSNASPQCGSSQPPCA